MAQAALRDQKERTVNVDRLKLIETLISNKKKHIDEYNEAVAGYRETLLTSLDAAFDKAKNNVVSSYERLKVKFNDLSNEELLTQPNTITLSDAQYLSMQVPHSYAKEYDAAIDMAKWDTREVLELTASEFTCFVRDEWDWKESFAAVNSRYLKKAV